MAIKNLSASARKIPALSVQHYEKGNALTLSDSGATNQNFAKILSAQAPKWSMLFDEDREGDNILWQIYNFCLDNLPPVEQDRIKLAAEKFAQQLLG